VVSLGELPPFREPVGVLTLTASYRGLKEVARLLTEAEENGDLDFDFSVKISYEYPKPEKGGGDED